MDAHLREAVRTRAEFRCEYCHLPEAAIPLISFHVEHIVARQHLDSEADNFENLALACDRCNAFKGPNLTSIDPLSGVKVDLFNPRQDHWPNHFRFQIAIIEGLTPIGRATVRLLNMNDAARIELREEWLEHDELL